MITMMSLIKVGLPAYAQVFFEATILFANMDVFSGESFFEKNFVFMETDPLNERFEQMGMDSKNFIMNSGSYFILLLLIYVSFYGKRFVNWVCTKYPEHWWVRWIAILVHEKKERPIEMVKASAKLFQEAYFDILMANMLGLLGMRDAYRVG